MVALPSIFGSAAPALRRPVVELSFGGRAGGGGAGFADAVGSALGIGASGGDAWVEHMVELVVETGLAPAVDVAEIALSTSGQPPSVTLGDTGRISLGYADAPAEAVFSGAIASVRHALDGVMRVTATNGGAALARLRVNQSFEQQTAGKIVKDLAGRATVETDVVEDGVDLPFFVVDDRRGAYNQVAALARRSNFLACFTPEGKLQFAPVAAGAPVQQFSYGIDILLLEASERSPRVGEVTTVGEGAAGSQGQAAWSWLVKDPAQVKRSAGAGDPKREVSDAALRSGDAAQSAANGIASAAGRMLVRGTLLVPGAPAVAVGRTIEVVDAPQAALNGQYLVCGVRHRYTKQGGFTTRMSISKAGAGGAGGLLGGLL